MPRRFADLRWPLPTWTAGEAVSAGIATAIGAVFLLAGALIAAAIF